MEVADASKSAGLGGGTSSNMLCSLADGRQMSTGKRGKGEQSSLRFQVNRYLVGGYLSDVAGGSDKNSSGSLHRRRRRLECGGCLLGTCALCLSERNSLSQKFKL